MRTAERLIKASDYEVQHLQRCTLGPKVLTASCRSYQFPFLLFSYFPRSEIALGTNTTGTDSDAVFMTAPESSTFVTEYISHNKQRLGIWKTTGKRVSFFRFVGVCLQIKAVPGTLPDTESCSPQLASYWKGPRYGCGLGQLVQCPQALFGSQHGSRPPTPASGLGSADPFCSIPQKHLVLWTRAVSH